MLVLGAPRSGTTLLASMIARHRDVSMLDEYRGDPRLIEKLIGKKIVGNKLCIPNNIELQRRGSLLFLAKILGWTKALKNLGWINEHALAKTSLEDYRKLGNLKIIGVLRDGNDVIRSNMRRGRKKFRLAAYRWCRAIEIIDELKRRDGDSVMVVAYEELVRNPEVVMKEVAAFLALDFDREMLQGFAYNPRYPGQERIDPEKAHRYVRDGVDFHVEDGFPVAYRKYQALLAGTCDDGRSGQTAEPGIQAMKGARKRVTTYSLALGSMMADLHRSVTDLLEQLVCWT
jgi:hypothetical protein